MSKVIYGGTFDPIHNGHIGVIRKLAAHYGEVVVMPCALSPFKTQTHASDEDRLAMCRLATQGLDGVTVSDYELRREGVSYTADTLRAHEGYAFCVGGDSFATLDRWYDADYLATREIALVRRGDDDVDDAVAAWRARGGTVVELGTEREVSSTVVRLCIGLGCACDDVADAVLGYARAHGLYEAYGSYFALYERFGLKPGRIEHTKRVAVTAARLALRYGADVDKTVDAALLHDIAKYVTVGDCSAMGVRLTLGTPLGVDQAGEGVRHALIGAEIAAQLLGRDEEIVTAIRDHTTGHVGDSLVAKLVCLADYIEPGRDHDGVETVRALAVTDPDEATLRMLEQTLAYLKERGEPIDRRTEESVAFYQNRVRNRA